MRCKMKSFKFADIFHKFYNRSKFLQRSYRSYKHYSQTIHSGCLVAYAMICIAATVCATVFIESSIVSVIVGLVSLLFLIVTALVFIKIMQFLIFIIDPDYVLVFSPDRDPDDNE